MYFFNMENFVSILQVILWVALLYFTGKVVNPLADKIHNPYVRVSNFLFDKSIQGFANDIISGLIIVVLLLLLLWTILCYVFVSYYVIDYVFLRLFGV